jgi:S-adenosyl-L-methionine hydrolase (adenosine-forming)
LTGPDIPAPVAVADTVFFLSDYGRRDEFVGVVHAVLRRLAPQVAVVDLTHDVPPFDVRAGAAALARAFPYLGLGVVLAVVDPGVGGTRRPVVLEVPGGPGPRWLVGPDNGLLVPAAEAAGGIERAMTLPVHTTPRFPGGGESATFDGRDLFVPAVAALCLGADPGGLGIPLDPSTLVRVADPVVESGTLGDGQRLLRAEVTWVDRFGNVQLAAAGEAVPSSVPEVAVSVGTGWNDPQVVRRVRTFSDLAPGEPGLLVDGNGHLALVVREGLAAARFDVGVGALVELVW